MTYWISNGSFQMHLKEYYLRYQKKLSFVEMMSYLHQKGELKELSTLPSPTIFSSGTPKDDHNFDDLNAFPILVSSDLFQDKNNSVTEVDIIPPTKEIFILRHFQYLQEKKHTHDYYEVDYVLQGSCTLHFLERSQVLKEGQLCILAPFSEHDLEVDQEDGIVLTLCIRKSTFHTTFFSLLSNRDLLSYFFRTTLQEGASKNYLLFQTDNQQDLAQLFKNLLYENLRNDDYSNTCCVSYINLIFSMILRHYGQAAEVYHYDFDVDITAILSYLQQHYRKLSLHELAKAFHYTLPYLSTLIRKSTGHTYSELIRELRLNEAKEYLRNTSMKISDIAEKTGYHSADHFSRVFRKQYQQSPLQYRKDNHPIFKEEKNEFK